MIKRLHRAANPRKLTALHRAKNLTDDTTPVPSRRICHNLFQWAAFKFNIVWNWAPEIIFSFQEVASVTRISPGVAHTNVEIFKLFSHSYKTYIYILIFGVNKLYSFVRLWILREKKCYKTVSYYNLRRGGYTTLFAACKCQRWVRFLLISVRSAPSSAPSNL